MNQVFKVDGFGNKLDNYEPTDAFSASVGYGRAIEGFFDDRFSLFKEQEESEPFDKSERDFNFDITLTKFESGSLNGYESTIPIRKTPSKSDDDDKISLDSMDSCKQLYSDVSSCFFDYEADHTAGISLANGNNENTEIEENLLKGIPKVESFILSKKSDSLFDRLKSGGNDVHEDTLTVKSSKTITRMKRWLKDEDRKLISIILELTKENADIKDELRGNIETNCDTKNIWLFIKNTLHTSRSIDFLQTRYFKLLGNQKLNSKEAALLSDKYDSISVEKFMVIFPGKTRDTLNALISELKSKEKQRKYSEELNDHEIEWNKDLELCSLAKQPMITLNTSTDKGLAVHIGDIRSLESADFLKKLDKKTLKRLSYSVTQIIGDIYHKKAQITKS